MKILLDVPYMEKDEARKRGARWDSQNKTWFFESIEDMDLFKKWMGNSNIVCENLYLLKMDLPCYKCGKVNEVVLFATDRSYAEEDDYELSTDFKFLSYVKWMPKELMKYVKNKNYYSSFSASIHDKYFMNHCSRCNASRGDHFLISEPDQSFDRHLFSSEYDACKYSKINVSFGIPFDADAVHIHGFTDADENNLFLSRSIEDVEIDIDKV